MPTYEYACRDCGEHLEVVQSFKDDALTVCPNCQGNLRKVFSAAGIIFKGSGWHIKDYKDSGKKPAAARSKGEGSSDDGASKASGDNGSGKDGSSGTTAKESTSSSKDSSSTAKSA